MGIEVDLLICRGVRTSNPIEYLLPLSEADVAEIGSQGGDRNCWVIRTAMQPRVEARRRLQERLLPASLADLTECRLFAESSDCVAVVIRDGVVWMLCEASFHPDRNCVFLNGPPESEEESLSWQTHGASIYEFADFLSAFRGFPEDYPPIAGHLWWSDPDQSDAIGADNSLLTKGLKDWASSSPLYKSLTGDFLLLRPDGVCGWSVAEEDEIRVFARSFFEFVQRFFRHFTTAFYFDDEQSCHFVEPLDPFCSHACCREGND